MKCPDCTDGKYRPLMGPAEDCATCGGSCEVPSSQELTGTGEADEPLGLSEYQRQLGITRPSPRPYTPTYWGNSLPSGHEWDTAGRFRLDQNSGLFVWENPDRTPNSHGTLYKDKFQALLRSEVLSVGGFEADISGMNFKHIFILCRTIPARKPSEVEWDAEDIGKTLIVRLSSNEWKRSNLRQDVSSIIVVPERISTRSMRLNKPQPVTTWYRKKVLQYVHP